jgi:hypothetical protein
MDQEPDLSLLKPRRFGLIPTLLIAFLFLGGIALLYVSPPRKLPKPPPPPKPGPLFVTVRPAADPTDPGWCCADPKGPAPRLTAAGRAACEAERGIFFEQEDQARRSCVPAAASGPTATSGSPRGPGKGA